MEITLCPDKINLYLDKELLRQCNEDGNKSKTITEALKAAYDYQEDFIFYTRRRLVGASDSTGLLELTDLVSHDRLMYNLLVRKRGFTAFLQKGHPAFFIETKLSFGDFEIDPDHKPRLCFSKLRNDFSEDQSCVELSFEEVPANG